MLQELLKKLSNGLDSFIVFLVHMWDTPKSEEIGGASTNNDPAFYANERNYHEQAIMEINDEISELEEERSQHEYFYNIANLMYGKLVQKEKN